MNKQNKIESPLFWVKWVSGGLMVIGLFVVHIWLLWALGLVGFIYGENRLSAQVEASKTDAQRKQEADEVAVRRAKQAVPEKVAKIVGATLVFAIILTVVVIFFGNQ